MRRSLRAAEFVPPVGLAAWGWSAAHYPFRLVGFGLAEAVALTAWPLLILAVVFGPPHVAALLVPRGTRMWWRRGACVTLLGWVWQLRSDAREHIPAWLRRAVLAADRRRCVYCGQYGQQLDHVRPWSCGGLNSLWNLITLCEDCNMIKSNYWRYPSGMVVYRAWPGYADEREAAQILAVERRARWSVLRWLRAAWAL